jgi:hypothetical protein
LFIQKSNAERLIYKSLLSIWLDEYAVQTMSLLAHLVIRHLAMVGIFAASDWASGARPDAKENRQADRKRRGTGHRIGIDG